MSHVLLERIRIDKKNTGEKKTNNNKQNKKTHKTNSLKKEPEKSGLKSQTLSAKMSIF
jgi:hypothetical protein